MRNILHILSRNDVNTTLFYLKTAVDKLSHVNQSSYGEHAAECIWFMKIGNNSILMQSSFIAMIINNVFFLHSLEFSAGKQGLTPRNARALCAHR